MPANGNHGKCPMEMRRNIDLGSPKEICRLINLPLNWLRDFFEETLGMPDFTFDPTSHYFRYFDDNLFFVHVQKYVLVATPYLSPPVSLHSLPGFPF
jgi:hypothetical protein